MSGNAKAYVVAILFVVALLGGAAHLGYLDKLIKRDLPKRETLLAAIHQAIAEPLARCGSFDAGGRLSLILGSEGRALRSVAGDDRSSSCLSAALQSSPFPAWGVPNAVVILDLPFQVVAGRLEAPNTERLEHVEIEWEVRDANPLDRRPIEQMLRAALPAVTECLSRQLLSMPGILSTNLPINFRLTPEGRAIGVVVGHLTDSVSPYAQSNFKQCVLAAMSGVALPGHDASEPIQVTTVVTYEVEKL